MALALNAGSNIRKCGMWGCSVVRRTTDVDHDDNGHRMSYPRYPLVMTNKKLLLNMAIEIVSFPMVNNG